MNHTTLSASTQVSRQAKSDTGLPPPDYKSVERLNELATARLSEIVRRNTSGEVGWGGYEENEIMSAKELLNREAQQMDR